ncbi:CRAL/TRIO domain-containing protein [Ramaria rubella]|nr:CRAL/TRIO domain-containing protein [Ramaria rubella]
MEPEEPQNALTRKFTDNEWKALKEFRFNLSSVFSEAFPDKSDANTSPIKLWGVVIDPNKKDARVSVILMKFLRARYLSVTEAQSMLISTLRWRVSFKLDEVMSEEFPSDVFGQLARVHGQDKGGRPVTYNLYGANKDLKAVFGDIPRFIRWRVSLMEKEVALLDFENTDQMVQIHDYEGVTLSSRDANSKIAANEATNIFSSHYPELLYKKFFVNVPTLMSWIYWAFKPLLPSKTFAKLSVVGYGPHTIGKALLPYIEPDQLPERYGGTSKSF